MMTIVQNVIKEPHKREHVIDIYVILYDTIIFMKKNDTKAL